MITLFFFLTIVTLSISETLTLLATFQNIGATYYSSTATECSIVEYCEIVGRRSSDKCQTGIHPMAHIDKTDMFGGSIMFLESDTEYSISINCDSGSETATERIRTRKEPEIPTQFNQTLYVVPSDSPTDNDCSATSPCEAQEAFLKLRAGTEIIFRPGIYQLSQYIRTYEVSGTREEPIYVHGDGTGDVIFDGSELLDQTIATQVNSNPNIYEFPVPNVPQSDCAAYLRMMTSNRKGEGAETQLRLIKYQDATDFLNLVYSRKNSTDFAYYCNGATTVQVNLNDQILSDFEIHFSNGASASFLIQGDWYIFEGLVVQNFGYSTGFAVHGGYNWIKQMIFRNCYRCLAFSKPGKARHNLVEECQFLDTTWNAVTWPGMKASKNLETPYLLTFGDSSTPLVANRGLVVRRNYFRGMWDAAVPYAAFYPIKNETNEIDIYENLFESIGDDCVAYDIMSSNVRYYSNVMDNAVTGVSVAPAIRGIVYVVNNTFINVSTVFKFNVIDDDPTGSVYMYHNVGISNRSKDDGYAGSQFASFNSHPWQLAKTRNNIMIPDRYAINQNLDSPVDCDYDAMIKSQNPTWNYVAYVLGTVYRSLEELYEGTGYEEHGIELNHTNIFDGAWQSCYLNENGTKILQGKGELIFGITDRFYKKNDEKLKDPDIGLLPRLEKDENKNRSTNVIVAAVLAVVFSLLAFGIFIVFLAIVTIVTAVLVIKKK